jgi:hypothetical protein
MLENEDMDNDDGESDDNNNDGHDVNGLSHSFNTDDNYEDGLTQDEYALSQDAFLQY